MKKYLFSISAILITTFGFTQSLERNVIASSGNFSSNSTISISSTLGEVFVTTLDGSSGGLTQGFQQPTNSIIDGIKSEYEDLGISLFPNPTNGSFNLNMNFEVSEKIKITLNDVLGRNIENRNIITTALNESFNLENEGDGIYFIQIRIKDKLYTEKIIKN